ERLAGGAEREPGHGPLVPRERQAWGPAGQVPETEVRDRADPAAGQRVGSGQRLAVGREHDRAGAVAAGGEAPQPPAGRQLPDVNEPGEPAGGDRPTVRREGNVLRVPVPDPQDLLARGRLPDACPL